MKNLSLSHMYNFYGHGHKVRNREKETPTTTVLKLVGTRVIPESKHLFLAQKEIVERECGGYFCSINENFRRWFLAGDGKIELPSPELVVKEFFLKKKSVDSKILEELQGSLAENTLGTVCSLAKALRKPSRGIIPSPALLYVSDIEETMRAISVLWTHRGPDIKAFSIHSISPWPRGAHVYF